MSGQNFFAWMALRTLQGFSTANSHRKDENVLQDDRNQQVIQYLSCVEYFQPRFAILENVLGTLELDEAFIIRCIFTCLVMLGYQVSPVPPV